jgi:endonuclease III
MTIQEKAENINTTLKKLFPNPKIALNYSTPIELLVAVVLSAQTTDKQVNVVTEDLFKKYKSIDDYVNTPLDEFQNDIKRIGLYKGKGKNIKLALETIKDKYNGVIPDSMSELIALPGIGRKTANILLSVIYNKNEGIAVDTHVKRLSLLFGLTSQTNPDKIERDLTEIIPNNDWRDFTLRMIEYGRIYCPASCKHINCPLKEYIK